MSDFTFIRRFFLVAGIIIPIIGGVAETIMAQETIPTGNVIFIHPDGTGASMWSALRYYIYGPDSLSHWDMMERLGVYRSHVLNSTNSSSHAGATIHSYGVKVNFDTYGNAPEKPVQSLSGKDYSIMMEARMVGMGTALINSGHICEPGTGVFAANAGDRNNTDLISEQIINSGVDVILSGGEALLIPEGAIGFHGFEGTRKDGKNLIESARNNGYTVVYTRQELLNISPETDRILGVFSPQHTFNDQSEEELRARKLPLYNESAPSIAEMTNIALRILKNKGKQFIIVVEEEGTDNFGNVNNASGVFEALRRADEAIGLAIEFAKENPNTLVITAADSDAGGMQLYAIRDPKEFDRPLPANTDNGAPLDGIEGKGSMPFLAAPDKNGVRLPFGVAWSCYNDVAGGVISRAHGLNSNLLTPNVDNTDIYRIMYATLFGINLPRYCLPVDR